MLQPEERDGIFGKETRQQNCFQLTAPKNLNLSAEFADQETGAQ